MTCMFHSTAFADHVSVKCVRNSSDFTNHQKHVLVTKHAPPRTLAIAKCYVCRGVARVLFHVDDNDVNRLVSSHRSRFKSPIESMVREPRLQFDRDH